MEWYVRDVGVVRDGIDLTPEVRETSGTTTRLILTYVRRTLGDDAVPTLLRVAGVRDDAAALEDERNWFPYRTKIDLLRAAERLTGDPQVARRIGELVVDEQMAAPLKVLLSLLGSPRHVLRRVAAACGKFSTVARMWAVEVDRTSGTVAYELEPGYAPHPLNCEYNLGLLSQLPVLFGLPPAQVSHPACQVDGADICIYESAWRERRRFPFWRRSRTPTNLEVSAVHEQLQALQQTVADLVSVEDLDEVLGRIATRATTAVRAQRYLLAVELDGEDAPRVHAEGVPAAEAEVLGRRLISDGAAALPGDAVLVADVVSSQRPYGRLAAVFPAGQDFFPDERELLEAYARLAAAALDSATALEEARTGQRTAEVLLGLATQLSQTNDVQGICEVAARAVPDIVGAPRSTVYLWDPRAETMRVAARHGFDADMAERVSSFAIALSDTPEMGTLVADRTPRVYERSHPDPYVQSALDLFETERVAVVPITVGDEFLGAIFASWRRGTPRPPCLDASFLARTEGLAHHVGTALGRARLLEQIQHQALHDPLTGLPNRALFEDRLEQWLAIWRRTGRGFAVLFVDLDRFKVVNDSLGHASGDDLLCQAAERLRAVVRETDSVARVGGDEFTVLLADVDAPADAEVVASKLVEIFSEPFRVAGRDVFVTASVGIAVPAGANDAETLLRRSDAAMYDAKVAGRNGWCWDRGLAQDPLERMSLLADLRNAIGRGELELFYQPQLDIHGGVAGVEALVRWQHPSRGLLGPGLFLPLAEEAGLITPLDLAVVRMALQQGARWLEQGIELRIAVNVSARTFCDTTFLTTVASALGATRFPPELVEFELTEHEQLPDLERARVIAEALHELGCGIAIDDVGRGYASLAWLQRLPVRRMKLDRSFISEVMTTTNAADLTTGLISLGRRLGCVVLAEGVEEQRQLEFLREHGCDEVQGFLFSPPLPVASLEIWLAEHTAVAGQT